MKFLIGAVAYLIIAGWVTYKTKNLMFDDYDFEVEDWILPASIGIVWPFSIIFILIILTARWFEARKEKISEEKK